MKKKTRGEKKRIGDFFPGCDHERRVFKYDAHIPERRSGTDRRKAAAQKAA